MDDFLGTLSNEKGNANDNDDCLEKSHFLFTLYFFVSLCFIRVLFSLPELKFLYLILAILRTPKRGFHVLILGITSGAGAQLDAFQRAVYSICYCSLPSTSSLLEVPIVKRGQTALAEICVHGFGGLAYLAEVP